MKTVPLKCLLLAAMIVSCCFHSALAQVQQQEVDLLVGK